MRKFCPIRNNDCINNCPFYEDCSVTVNGVDLTFSEDITKFECQFLYVFSIAFLQNKENPVDALKEMRGANNNSIYSILSSMGMNVEEVLERMRGVWKDINTNH